MPASFPPRETEDKDATLLHRLDEVPVSPVFILGLHRSGTTFLYESLASLLPVAPVTAYHVLFYRRLLANHLSGGTGAAQQALDAHFRRLGMSTRQIDEVALSHSTCEEYGFVLGKYCGALDVSDRTAPLLRELCQKLLFTNSDAEAVLLKNPWDTGRAARIRELFPGAKLVYIRRDPVRVLNSQFKSSLVNGGSKTPYLMMLLRHFRLGERFMGAEKALYRLVGRTLYGWISMRWLMRDIARELAGYKEALAGLPPEAYVEISYEDLTRDPQETLARVVAYLGLEPTAPLTTIQPRPRVGPLHPLVEAQADRFRRSLERRGLK